MLAESVSLGCNNEILKSLNLHFNDDGKLDNKFNIQTYDTDSANMDDMNKNSTFNKIQNDFAKDAATLINELDEEGKIKELKCGKFICWQNTPLLNYLTSALHDEIKKSSNGKYNDVTAVALQTSGIRGGIKEGATNLDLMKVFDGINENLSELYIGEVKGKDLVGIIVENVRDNLGKDKRERNTLIYWSNIQINRGMIDSILEGNSNNLFVDAIKLRADDNKFTQDIDLNMNYKIILPNKYIIKTDIEYPNKIRRQFKSIGKTPDELFRLALKRCEYKTSGE